MKITKLKRKFLSHSASPSPCPPPLYPLVHDLQPRRGEPRKGANGEKERGRVAEAMELHVKANIGGNIMVIVIIKEVKQSMKCKRN